MSTRHGSKARIFVVISLLTLIGTSGCSRVVSPSGRGLFSREAADQFDWDMATAVPYKQDPARPGTADSHRMSDDGMQNQEFYSAEYALDNHYVQSMRVPEKTPPRLIPIESIEYPGNSNAHVMSASALDDDRLSSRAELALAFSDSVTDEATDRSTVEQANVVDEIISGSQTNPATANLSTDLGSSAKAITPENETPTPNESADRIAKATPNSSETVWTKSEMRASPVAYEKKQATATRIDRYAKFDPAEFSAARRKPIPKSIATTSTESPSPTANPTSNSEPNKGIESATKIAETSSKEERPLSTSPQTTAPSDKANVSGKPDSALVSSRRTVQVAESRTQSRQQETESTPANSNDVDALKAAGITVDNKAFEVLIPKQKMEPLPASPLASDLPKTEPQGDEKTAVNTFVPQNDFKPISRADYQSDTPCAEACPTDLTPMAFQSVPLTKPSVIVSSAANKSAKRDETKLPATKVEVIEPAKLSSNPDASSSDFIPAIPSQRLTASTKTNATLPVKKATQEPNVAPLRQAKTEQSRSFDTGLLIDLLPVGTSTSSNKSLPVKSIPKPPTDKSTSTKSPLNVDFAVAPIAVQFVPDKSQTASHSVEVDTNQESDLRIVNSQFCTEIKGFGQLTPFTSHRFSNNQRTLVYCEVENYESHSQATPEGTKFITRFRGRYQVLDAQGTVAQAGQFPEIEDITNRKRKDFYLYFPVTLRNLPLGDYELKLSIEESTRASIEPDQPNRLAEQSLKFSVIRNQ